jgi:hypothetical protein
MTHRVKLTNDYRNHNLALKIIKLYSHLFWQCFVMVELLCRMEYLILLAQNDVVSRSENTEEWSIAVVNAGLITL